MVFQIIVGNYRKLQFWVNCRNLANVAQIRNISEQSPKKCIHQVWNELNDDFSIYARTDGRMDGRSPFHMPSPDFVGEEITIQKYEI